MSGYSTLLQRKMKQAVLYLEILLAELCKDLKCYLFFRKRNALLARGEVNYSPIVSL